MGKKKKNQLSPQQVSRQASSSLQTSIAQAKAIQEKGLDLEAIQILEPLVASHPRAVELFTTLGNAYINIGDLWSGVKHYEKALSLGKDERLLVTLGFAYLDLGLNILALQTLRQALKFKPKEPMASQLSENIQDLEDSLLGTAQILGRPPEIVARGLRFFEEGQIALHSHAYPQSIHLNRKAIQLLGDFPPAYNNLSQALFYHGEPDEAIRTARRVTARYPDNIQALSNLVRFLAWTGKTEDARQVWEQLKPNTPIEPGGWMKKIEAAAIMDADEYVYRLIKEIDIDQAAQNQPKLIGVNRLYLAIAEANLGYIPAAKSRLMTLKETFPMAGEILNALQEGKRGLGWTDRYPYFHATDLLHRQKMKEFLDLIKRKEVLPAKKFRREVERYAARFPQLVLFGKKTLLEEQQIKPAIGLLTTIGTPEAYAVLREFGLGVIGDDESRMQVLFALSEAGQFSENEPIKVWQGGEWRDIHLKKYEITDQRILEYDPQVIDILEEAFKDISENRLAQAEKKYKRVLALEPRAKEAYNNLASIYSQQGNRNLAREMLEKAVELDPLYVMPRCNLALFLLDDNKIEEAEEVMFPLLDVYHLTTEEIAFLSYVRALIHVDRNEYEQARKLLLLALEVYPEYELAQDMLGRMDLVDRMKEGFTQILEDQSKRNLAKRQRQRTLITNPDPHLVEALGIYSKDILTGISRLVISEGGWSSFKKAKLLQHLVEYLQKPDSFTRIFDRLSPEEKLAFERVLSSGGFMAWDGFAQEFGEDMEESPYWNYKEPKTVMGRLRAHGLLVEATVDGKLLVCIPMELRKPGHASPQL
jgi:tetratricopeptide (TPR) repeat protein